MTPEDLQTWLAKHADDISRFMDYEPTIEPAEALYETLGHWFGNPDWNTDGDAFAPLGIDGTGGQIAAWIRPGVIGPAPVVFFGSEGGAGVLTTECARWAQVIAHAPGLVEYPEDFQERLHPAHNWILTDLGVGDLAPAHEALERYRAAVEERLGPLPPLDFLTAATAAQDKALDAWCDARVR